MLDPYRKTYGSGNTDYVKMMIGQFEKSSGRWYIKDFCQIMDTWNKNTKTDDKSETLHIRSAYQPELEGSVECRLMKEDPGFYYIYEWFKTATTGTMRKIPKTSMPDTDAFEFDKMPGLKVTLFPDAIVDGQDCFVYRYDLPDYEMEMYFWFSKTKGFEILIETFISGKDTVSANYIYDLRKIDKDNNFYDPAYQGVTTWKEV
jgi:hypothetical protein